MNMHMRLPHSSEVRRVPGPVKEYMRKRFLLKPEYIRLLRCFEYKGLVGEKTVTRLKIFDPKDVREKRIPVKTLKDLESVPDLVLFEGYLDEHGYGYAADRRTSSKSKKNDKGKGK